MFKALLKHNESTNATIAIFKGAYPLKLDMEVQDFRSAYLLLGFISIKEFF